MRISEPEISLTQNDKQLISLVGHLLLESSMPSSGKKNFSKKEIPLTDEEASELIGLIDKLISAKGFIEKTTFVEGISGSNNGADLKRIYLKGVSASGRSLTMSSRQWDDYLSRLSFGSKRGYVHSMEYERFMQMELKLMQKLKIHPRVAHIVAKALTANESHINDLRAEKNTLKRGYFSSFIKRMRKQLASKTSGRLLSQNQLTGLLTLTADLTILFTTRDWNVVGTMSSMAVAAMQVSDTNSR